MRVVVWPPLAKHMRALRCRAITTANGAADGRALRSDTYPEICPRDLYPPVSGPAHAFVQDGDSEPPYHLAVLIYVQPVADGVRVHNNSVPHP